MLRVHECQRLMFVMVTLASSFSLELHAFLVTRTSRLQLFHTATTFLDARKPATAPKKTKGTTSSSSGFGGAAVEPCPCGSGNGYMKCCGKIHSDEKIYANSTAEQVVRARYSAYAKREVSCVVTDNRRLEHVCEGVSHPSTSIRWSVFYSCRLILSSDRLILWIKTLWLTLGIGKVKLSEFHDDFVPIPAWYTVIVGIKTHLFYNLSSSAYHIGSTATITSNWPNAKFWVRNMKE